MASSGSFESFLSTAASGWAIRAALLVAALVGATGVVWGAESGNSAALVMGILLTGFGVVWLAVVQLWKGVDDPRA